MKDAFIWDQSNTLIKQTINSLRVLAGDTCTCGLNCFQLIQQSIRKLKRNPFFPFWIMWHFTSSSFASFALLLPLFVFWQFRSQLWQCQIFNCHGRWPIDFIPVNLSSCDVCHCSGDQGTSQALGIQAEAGKVARKGISQTIKRNVGGLANNQADR